MPHGVSGADAEMKKPFYVLRAHLGVVRKMLDSCADRGTGGVIACGSLQERFLILDLILSEAPQKRLSIDAISQRIRIVINPVAS